MLAVAGTLEHMAGTRYISPNAHTDGIEHIKTS